VGLLLKDVKVYFELGITNPEPLKEQPLRITNNVIQIVMKAYMASTKSDIK